MMHKMSPSHLTAVAYHAYGSTPLMLSIIRAQFAASHILLEAGARVDLRNCRGMTAATLARVVHAPSGLVALLDVAGQSLEDKGAEEEDDDETFSI